MNKVLRSVHSLCGFADSATIHPLFDIFPCAPLILAPEIKLNENK